MNNISDGFKRKSVLSCNAGTTFGGNTMDEQKLIYDWNVINYEYARDKNNHPHDIWFDDETLRDGLQSPSALNPSIEQKHELLSYMERLGNTEGGFRFARGWPISQRTHRFNAYLHQ